MLSCNSPHIFIVYERSSWTISQVNISIWIDETISWFKMLYVQKIAPFWFKKCFAMQLYIHVLELICLKEIHSAVNTWEIPTGFSIHCSLMIRRLRSGLSNAWTQVISKSHRCLWGTHLKCEVHKDILWKNNTNLNTTGGRPFLCFTKIPSRHAPMNMSLPWLSCKKLQKIMQVQKKVFEDKVK